MNKDHYCRAMLRLSAAAISAAGLLGTTLSAADEVTQPTANTVPFDIIYCMGI